MNQARRKKSSNGKSRSRSGGGLTHCFSMLLAGTLIGGIGTALWMGARSGDATQIGSGIRQMMEISKRKEAAATPMQPAADSAPAAETSIPETKFDFYTVLPEIETVITEPEKEAAPAPVAKKPVESEKVAVKPAASAATAAVAEKPLPSGSFYMLQAGSYSKRSQADRLKAQLAMKGLPSQIQKVTIQGKGDFYRVRLGPFRDQKQLTETDRRLGREGIRALRLKVSQGG